MGERRVTFRMGVCLQCDIGCSNSNIWPRAIDTILFCGDNRNERRPNWQNWRWVLGQIATAPTYHLVIFRSTPSAAGPFWLLGIAIWGAWCLLFEVLGAHSGTSGAPWGAISAPRDHPGEPWEQQDGFEVVENRIFIDLGMIWGFVYVSCWVSKCFKIRFVC